MVEHILEGILNEVLDNLGYPKCAKVIISNRKDLCDYQFDGLFHLAKTYHKSPMEIGNEIEKVVNSDYDSYFSSFTFEKPGFLNMKLSDSFINSCLNEMMEKDKFGIDIEKEEMYVIDYGGPNIAKPLHVGHMRPAIVGESIKRIIKYLGHKVISDVHFGDFGLQIGEVIYGMKQKGISINNVTLEDLNEIYPSVSALVKEDEKVKEECAKITKDLQDGNKEYEKYYLKIFELSKSDIQRIYKYLDIDFDLWYGEMSSRTYIKNVEEVLKKKNLAHISEGAMVVDVSNDTDKKELPPLIFKKSNGAYLYGSTDLATIYQREKDFHPDHILYVADVRQSMHFTQVFRVSEKAKLTNATLEHLGFGTINGKDGKPYKTRSGETPKLDLLLEEVKSNFINKREENKNMKEEDLDKIVNGILKFADLINHREKDYIFDLQKFSEVVGKTGPYVLYTTLRIHKVVEKEETSKLNSIIYNEQDRNLRMKLLEFHSMIKDAEKNKLPSVVANYIYELCMVSNAFYQNNHILGLEDLECKKSWITVLNLSYHILNDLLNLLGMEVPSVM